MCQQCWYKKSYIGLNFCNSLRCFVKKVSNVASLHFFGGIFWHILQLYVTFWHFSCTIWVFWAFYAILLQFRFVVLSLLFGSFSFWSINFCVKKLSSCMSGYWCYYPHRSRDLVSPVCGIFTELAHWADLV